MTAPKGRDLAPRCGRAMKKREAPGSPILKAPVCGRPDGHKGPCRSEAAMARYRRPYKPRKRREEIRRRRYRQARDAGLSSREADRFKSRRTAA